LNYFLISVGAVLGALSRYQTVTALSQYSEVYPWGTQLVNILGCLMAGFMWQSFATHTEWQRLSPLFMIGFLGSFTTFSAFSLETVKLLRNPETIWLGASYIATSVVVCLLATGAGIWLGQLRT
jgi:CrcB protein